MSDRKKNGQFSPGKSGNPKGRPKSESASVRKLLSQHSEAVVDVVTKAALDGDLQACKIILDRVCPPLKPQAAQVSIKHSTDFDSLQLAEAWLKAASDGSVPADVASQMVVAIGQYMQTKVTNEKIAEETTDLIDKIQIEVIDPTKPLPT